MERYITTHKYAHMLSLQKHHITDLYVLVDELLPKMITRTVGRKSLLSNSELVTILLWNSLTVQSKTLKTIHKWVSMYHTNEFPNIPKYNAFIEHCHRAIPQFMYVLEQLLCKDMPVRFVDSTMVPVCKIVRADSHKVAKSVAAFGKNHQGWHYGFKLHASIDHKGRLCQITMTPADVHDAQALPKLVNNHTKIAVGDAGYTARVMARNLFEKYGTIIISPPHYKQKRKVMTRWQHLLLTMRPKIESTFDILKEHMHFVTSFPRSLKGFLLHYVRILIGYQICAFS